MKVLLDENLPHELRGLLTPHDVFTVAFLQWSGIRNGDLMRNAQAEGFECVLNFDEGFGHQ